MRIPGSCIDFHRQPSGRLETWSRRLGHAAGGTRSRVAAPLLLIRGAVAWPMGDRGAGANAKAGVEVGLASDSVSTPSDPLCTTSKAEAVGTESDATALNVRHLGWRDLDAVRSRPAGPPIPESP
jgi:hypothetical protein